jgi:hypothetical protein
MGRLVYWGQCLRALHPQYNNCSRLNEASHLHTVDILLSHGVNETTGSTTNLRLFLRSLVLAVASAVLSVRSIVCSDA